MEAIWNQAHPAENAGMSGSWPDAWGSTGAINDPDPAYRKYNAVKTFYEEHQYLAWYGNEESGQQTPEEPGVLASGKPLRAQEELLREGNCPGRRSWRCGWRQNRKQPGPGSRCRRYGNIRIPGAKPVPGDHNGDTGAPHYRQYICVGTADGLRFPHKTFYSVHTSTTAGRDLMNAKDLLSRDMTMKGTIPSPRYLSTTPIPRKPIRIPARDRPWWAWGLPDPASGSQGLQCIPRHIGL